MMAWHECCERELNGEKGRRRKEVVVGVLNGEKEWQSKSVVEMACASTMGTAPLMGGMCFGASQTNQPCAH